MYGDPNQLKSVEKNEKNQTSMIAYIIDNLKNL